MHIITPRETEILFLIAYENTMQQIAIALHISLETVKTHRKNILTKLKVKNTAGMIRRAFELGLLTVNPLKNLKANIATVITLAA